MPLDESLKPSVHEAVVTSMPTFTISGADCSMVKKRTSLTNAEKLSIVRWHEMNNSTQRKTAEHYGISKSALNRMLSDKERLEAVAHSRNDSLRKKFRPCKYNDINLAMRKWFEEEKSKNTDFYADKMTLYNKARDVAAELGYPVCPVDISWVMRFKYRCDMSKKTYNSGRVGASVCQEKILELSTSTSTFCFVCGQIVAENMKLTHVLEQHVKKATFICPGCNYSSTFDCENVRCHIAREHPNLLTVGVVDHRAMHQKLIVEHGERCFPGSVLIQRNDLVSSFDTFEGLAKVSPSPMTNKAIKQESRESFSPIDFTPTDQLARSQFDAPATRATLLRSLPKLEPEDKNPPFYSIAPPPLEKHSSSVRLRQSMMQIASLLQIAADLNLKFTFNADECGEYSLEACDGSGKMVVIADCGVGVRISERIGGEEVDVEVSLMANWEQVIDAVRGKCNGMLQRKRSRSNFQR